MSMFPRRLSNAPTCTCGCSRADFPPNKRFGRKLANHAAAGSLHFLWYNFGHVHATLTRTNQEIRNIPVMAAGVSDRVWTPEGVVQILDQYAE